MALYSFSSVGLLCFATSLMVAIASGTSPYYSRPLASVAGAGSRGAGGSTFNRFYENAAARSMQVGSCAVSGALEVCHTADLESDFQVHICPSDGSPCDQNVCYYTSVPPCCPGTSTGLECKSVTTLLVEGKTFNVTHYRIPLTNNQICVSISPAVKICDEACETRCIRIACSQNVECDSNGANCQCREGFTEESECCDCEDGYYQNGTRCIKFCRDNCQTTAGFDENGQPICTSCFNGYEPPTCCNCPSDRVEVDNRICKCRANLKPDGTCAEGALETDCCECDASGNATHAFYKTASGECIPFCKSNCAVIGSSGCTTCKTGFMTEPECCQCEPGRTEVNGVCKCDANLKPDGTCAEGALEPDCCECDTTGNATHAFYRTPSGECKPYCDNNCAGGVGFGCSTCKAGFMSPPECCQCVPGRDGVCKCRANLKPDGTCAEGALEPDCCECDTTGNATHAFYKTPSGECKPFCKNNCAVTGGSGCTTCNDGFITEPECCQRTDDCDQPQNLFFFIDATASNKFENFCPLMIVLQMVVAAFSPSPSSGIQIRSLLFSDNAKHRGPSSVFETNSSCLNAVQGEDHSLRSLMEEFGICLDRHRIYNSKKFPSMCGEGTSAVWGLKEIRDNVTRSVRKSTVLMITDGIIEDGEEERTKVLRELKWADVTIIEAGYGDADLSIMERYTDPDNIMIDDDPVKLGKAIVNKLKVKGILCDKYAKNVIESLEQAERNDVKLTLFCRCHRTDNINKALCLKKKYPVCGGNLSVGLNPTGMSETLDFQESDLEEEILAAVENVLERFDGH